jgi:hypothetical protein
VTTTLFNTSRELIVVRAHIWGAHRSAGLSLAVDTGSSESVIKPEIIDQLGYGARHGDVITRVRSAVSDEQGYILRVAQFAALGFAFPDFRVHVFELAGGWGIDGLLGLNFLRLFNYEVRSIEGLIRTERAAA